jgi:butyrate kinase
MKILAINPGSTSTKIAVYINDRVIFYKNSKHSVEDLAKFATIADQYEYRKDIVIQELVKADTKFADIEIVIGRGGLLKPIPSGVYEVNEALKKDLIIGVQGQHASNLGGLIADSIAQSLPNAKAFIADPVVVDELEDIARISGHPRFRRISIFHALNQKSIARTYAKNNSKNYEDLNLIVAHLGGGISVGAHCHGKVIDVNQALDGEGPFSPERSGTLPVGELARLCFSHEFTYDEVKKMITGQGGFAAYLNTNDTLEVEKMIEMGNEYAQQVYDAMAYQVAKEIGAMSTVMKGEVDAILITGGLANSKNFVDKITERITKIAPIAIYPGEDEMRALALNALMVANKEIEPRIYE